MKMLSEQKMDSKLKKPPQLTGFPLPIEAHTKDFPHVSEIQTLDYPHTLTRNF